MLGRMGRWSIDLVVAFFALYAFAFLPLGDLSAYDHMRAILTTRAAKEAGNDLVQAGSRLHERLLGGESTIETRGEPVIPDLPRNALLVGAPDAGSDASL